MKAIIQLRAPEAIPELFLSVRAGTSGCAPISLCQKCHFVFPIGSGRAYSDLCWELMGKMNFSRPPEDRKDVLLSLALAGRKESSFAPLCMIANPVVQPRSGTWDTSLQPELISEEWLWFQTINNLFGGG